MRIFKYLNILIGTTLLLGCAARPARAQFIGYSSPQSAQQTLAPAGTACTGSNQVFTVGNLGQTQHLILGTPSGTTTFTLNVYGTDSLGNIIKISDNGFKASGQIPVQAAGYYPVIKVYVSCTPAVSGTFGLTYSGTSATNPIQDGDFLLEHISKGLFWQVAANTSQGAGLNPPFGNSSSTLMFVYVSSPVSGSTLSVQCSDTSGSVLSVLAFNLANTSSTQTFSIPPGPCPIELVSYTNGGAAGTFTLTQTFTLPGTISSTTSAANLSSPLNEAVPLTEKGARWSEYSTQAAGFQAKASISAGATGVRHVVDCVSYSAGAITAPAATVLEINLRDGATGAGTIIWQKWITIPATAAPHYDANFCGLNLIGSAATAMTLEFSAGLTNENESVSLTGYDVQ